MAGVAPDVTAIPLGRPSPGASSNQPERLGHGRPRGMPHVAPIRFCSRRGLPCRKTLPPARCALTAPFHPYPNGLAAFGRFAFCGAFPGVAPAGRYPAPFPYGARTFLRFEKRRPSGRLAVEGIGGTLCPGQAKRLHNSAASAQIRSESGTFRFHCSLTVSVGEGRPYGRDNRLRAKCDGAGVSVSWLGLEEGFVS